MNLEWRNAYKHPLSTFMGIASVIGGGYALLMTDPEFAPLLAKLPVKWLGRMALASLLWKFVTRAMSKDVGREEAKVPGQPDPQMVNAHGTPDVPGAKVVSPSTQEKV